MDNIQKQFYKLHEKRTYLDKYGGSVVATFLILSAFFLLFSYMWVRGQMEPIKRDWANMKCHPGVVPFAGLINKPAKMGIFDFTAANFQTCMMGILQTIVGHFTAPFFYVTNAMKKIFITMQYSIEIIRSTIRRLKNVIMQIFGQFISKARAAFLPVQKILIRMQDTFKKVNAIFATLFYMILSMYLTLKAWMGAFLTIVIIALVIGVVAIIALWILPFTWPVAAISTTFFLLISIPTAILAGWMQHIMNITSRGVPEAPGKPAPPWPFCFDENTMIKTKNDSIPIKNIKIGDILFNGDVVTATFKVDYKKGENIYNLNNILVSGSHWVFYNDTWIFVKDHPNSSLSPHYNKKYLYCYNTSSKRIFINDMVFMDWDELQNSDIKKLITWNYIKPEDIHNLHSKLDSGLHHDTKIHLFNGLIKYITDINVGDILDMGEKVLGIVRIKGDDMPIFNNYINNKKICATNLFLKLNTNSLASFRKRVFGGRFKTLYHIITDTKTFHIDGIEVYDYNAAIENILDMREKFL